MTLEYQGTAYAGWQIQPEQSTVQGEITGAVFRTTGQQVTITGAGRTDAGVHALGQVANFQIDHNLPPEKYRDALNYYLPEDIRVKASCEVEPDFNARRDARWKRYRYLVSAEQSALYRRLRWEIAHRPNLQTLRAAAELVVGEHDFAPFCVTASRKSDNRCLIHAARWCAIGSLLVFEIRGDRFLHGMVRSLVGAMVNLATIDKDTNPQNLTLDRFRDMISSSTVERAVFTAPPQGLYLVSVHYRKEP